MKEQFIDLELDDSSTKDLLDRIMAYVESARIHRDSVKLSDDIEKHVIGLENLITDLNISVKDNWRNPILISKTNAMLKLLISFLKSSDSLEMFKLLDNYIISLHNFVKQGIRLEKEFNFRKVCIYLDTTVIVETWGELKEFSEFQGKIGFMKAIISQMNSANIEAMGFLKNESRAFNAKSIHKSKIINEKITHWDIEISFTSSRVDESLLTLYLLLQALNKVDGVEAELMSIHKGSLHARIVTWFKSQEAKGQAEELLEGAKKYVKGNLEKAYEENEKIKKENEKIELENQGLRHKLDEQQSPSALKKKILELEGIELDNERKKIENEKMRLDIFRQKMDTLKNLLGENLISEEQFRLMINDQLFLGKVGDKVDEGMSIKEIEKKKD